jgi:hypothetical protein
MTTAVQVQYRRGTASQVAAFTGAQGEMVVDTTNQRVVVQDGSTQGGWPQDVAVRTAVANANYTALATDRIIAFTSIGAARTVSLPASSSYPTGTVLKIVDESGSCSATNTITVSPNGSDTINGGSTAAIQSAYGFIELESSGAGKWTILAAANGVTLTGPVITGGTINNTVIGGSTRAAAAVTSLGVGESAPGAGIVNVSGSYQVAGSQISAANLSDGTTGTGAIVKADAPAFTGNPIGITALGVNESTPGTGIINVSGSYQVGGSQLSVANLSNGQTGTGEVVLQTSPILAGTVTGPDSGTWGSGGINDSIIGGATPAAGSFTTLSLTRHAVSDASYTVGSGISTVAYTAITAARTVSMPASSSFNAGQQLMVVDESGNCSATKTITLSANGSDTIDGASSAVINAPYGYIAIVSNASGRWTIVDQGPQVLELNGLTGDVALAATDGAVIAASGTTVSIGGPGGMVNKFRNATMDVWQRGTSGTATTTAGPTTQTGPDGWYIVPTGASVTWAQAGGRLLTKSSLQVTGATSVTDLIIKQRIESLIAAALCSQTVTMQAQVYNGTGAAITPKLTVNRPSAQDNYASVTADVNAVSLQSCANGAWTLVAYTFAANAASYNGLEIVFDFGNNFGAGTKTVQITECDIRVTPGAATGLNSNPPPPELRPITAELPACQRYLYSIFPNLLHGMVSEVGMADGTGGAVGAVKFPVTMRAVPTLTISAAGDFCPMNSSAVAGAAFTSLTLGGATTADRAFFVGTGSSGLVAGNACFVLAADTSATMTYSAEL